MTFLYQYIADLLNKFRLQNPALFTVIVIILTAAAYYLTSEIAPAGSWIPTVVAFISGVLGALNVRTFPFSSEGQKALQEQGKTLK